MKDNKKIILQRWEDQSITFQEYGNKIIMIIQEVYESPVESIITRKKAMMKISNLLLEDYKIIQGNINNWI